MATAQRRWYWSGPTKMTFIIDDGSWEAPLLLCDVCHDLKNDVMYTPGLGKRCKDCQS